MKKLFYLAVAFLPVLVSGQSTDQNYVKTKVYKTASTTSIATPSETQATQSITYFDGLGRPIQQVAHKQSASGKDIAIPIVYDEFGRQTKDYLPIPLSTNDMSFTDNTMVISDPINYYTTLYGADGAHRFSEKRLENSPLQRILEQAAPGNDWSMDSAEKHTIRFDYQTNVADEVKLFKASANWDPEKELYEITFVNGSGTVFYEANQLYKTVVKNENWKPADGHKNTTQEFKDKDGRVVMKRTYGTSKVNTIATETWHETYYVYDQFGNLTYVIPPLVEGAINSDKLSGLCYQYKYDYRNRLVEKKLPGKQWEFIVYDKLDRVVMTGPARPPFAHLSKDGWMFTKYDAFDRVVMTGFMALPSNQSFTHERRKEKQTERNSQTSNFNETRLATGTTPAASPGAANNPIHSYSNLSLPTSGYYVLSINYYDDYSYTGAPTVPQTVGDGEIVFFNNTKKPKGLPTGKWTRVLANTLNEASAKKEISYTFYDYKSRPIRTYVTNNLSTTSYIQTDVKYDFEGKIMETITRHKPSSDVAEITIRDYFTYSEQGRLLTHSNKVNNNSIQLLADNTYNELGQLIGKKVGNTVGSTPLQEVDYYYNIRGWLKSINDITNLGTDLFAFKLNYNEVENETNYEGKALYNGNIAETYWRTGKDDVKRKYGYFYDDLNRLTNAVYQRPNSSGIGVVTNAYNESLTYDKNGNIITLQRNGDIEEIAPALEIDDLNYVYRANTNELIKVTDNLTTSPSGFNDRANNAEEYGYDAHGNMTRDDNKGITDIRYNHLNLPIKITFGTQGEIAYVYNAEGKKLEKTVTQTGSTAVTTKYLDGFQYVDNVLQFFPHAEGYVKKNGNNYNYVFNYTDHLGNVRLSYQDVDLNSTIETSEIIEENNYYPFGLKHSGYNNTLGIGGNSEAQKYGFENKEWQNELGLNVYDFGARSYDPALARWTTVDPVIHFNQSVYTAFDNNPIYFADPSGTKTASSITDAWNQTPEGENSTWYNDGDEGFTDNPPKEGATREETVNFGTSYLPNRQKVTKYYHAGGVDGSEAGWYSANDYFETFRTTIRRIGQGQASIEILGSFNFTDDVLIAMTAWAAEAYQQYGGKANRANGAITPLDFSSPFFAPGIALKLAQLSKYSKFAFWSGRGTQQAAIKAGYKVLGHTDAGKNLALLTADMEYSVGSQAWHFWGRLSQAYARKIPRGSTVNVFVTRGQNANPMSIWSRFERPILEANKVKIKYNFVD